MQTAEQLLAIIRDRGQRGLPLEDVYRQLYNPGLYLAAYGKLSRNDGAMTKGVTTETVDGMSEEKIAGIIALLREEKYRWTPVRRVYIEKQNSTKKRPLGIPMCYPYYHSFQGRIGDPGGAGDASPATIPRRRAARAKV